MAHVIREMAVDPPVPADLVVYRRADIERFVTAARRTVARLEAELDAARSLAVNGAAEPEEEPAVGGAAVIALPPWTDRAPDETDSRFFEALRDDQDRVLIAGAEIASTLYPSQTA
jgi:hypothetical protein